MPEAKSLLLWVCQVSSEYADHGPSRENPWDIPNLQYFHPSRVHICSSEPAPIPPNWPGSFDDVADAIGEFMEDYSAYLEELQRLDLPERKDIDNKTS